MSTRALPARATRPAAGLVARFARLLSLRRSRARLAALDAHILRDIGISPDDAMAEASRPLWDAPAGWRR